MVNREKRGKDGEGNVFDTKQCSTTEFVSLD